MEHVLPSIPAPSCQQPTAVYHCGLNATGSQRWRCRRCQRYFTPLRKPLGHAPASREAALRLYPAGASLRAIGRLLHVNHQSVANWVAAAAAQLPAVVSAPTAGETVEVDELYTFVGKKKPATMC
jgi:transposase-like protein